MSFQQRFRDAQVLGFDALMRLVAPEKIARGLENASHSINKEPFVVFVEQAVSYGNVRAAVLEFSKTAPLDSYIFISPSEAGHTWAQSHSIPHAKVEIGPGAHNAQVWSKLLRAAVSVHESHDFWHKRADLFSRALLSGSHKIQLWHGSTGPIGKEIGLGRLSAQPSLWHFTAIASTSTGWDELVCEPNSDEARRLDRVQAKSSIHDIEFRLVDVLRAGDFVPPKDRRIAVTPTFPETANGEGEIVKWLAQLGKAALKEQCDVDVFLHPASKPSLRKAVSNMSGIALETSGFNSAKLREYSAIVTDFSSIAHDALLIGTPVVMVTVDLAEYKKSREILIDQEQWNAAYVVSQAEEFTTVLHDLFGPDSRKQKRQSYRQDLLGALPGQPGEPTLNAISRGMGI